MKANELMIGDWVGYLPTWKNEDGSIERDGGPNNPIPFKVEMVCWDCVILDDREGSSFDTDDISLYPISLTREILENNGFTRFGTSYILKGEHFGLDNPSNPNNYLDNYWLKISIKAVHIEYVHELQHALRLCGIEKTIEL